MRTSKVESAVVLLLVAVTLAIVSSSDLSILMAVVDSSSVFGNLFQIIGEVPNYLLALFSGAILMMFHDGQSALVKVLTSIGGTLVFLLGATMGAMMPVQYAGSKNIVIMGVLFLLITVGAISLVNCLPKHKRLIARRLASMGALWFVSMLFIMNVMKMAWARPRFRDMTNPLVEYLPWYSPNGFTTNDAFMSFPSGHTAQATVILMLTMLPLLFVKLQGKTAWLLSLSYIWIVLVSFSRVVMGAHFPSDVIVGFLLSWLLFQLWKRVFFKDATIQQNYNTQHHTKGA